MSSRVKAELHSVYRKGLAPFDAACLNVTQTVFDDGKIAMMGNVSLVPPSAMIGMAMGDQGLLHRLPGIQVDIGPFAIDSFVRKCQ